MRQEAKWAKRAKWAQSASWPLGLLALLLSFPGDAHACAVCNDPTDKNRLAFLATTAFMTVLPLSLLGGLLAWLRRRARAPEGPADSATPGG